MFDHWKKRLSSLVLVLFLVFSSIPFTSANTNGLLQGVSPDSTSITQLTDGTNTSYTMAANSIQTWTLSTPKNITGYYLHSYGTVSGGVINNSQLEFYNGDTLLGTQKPNAHPNSAFIGNYYFQVNYSNVTKVILRNNTSTTLNVFDLDITDNPNVRSPHFGSVVSGLTAIYSTTSLSGSSNVTVVSNHTYNEYYAVANNAYLYYTLPASKTLDTYSFYSIYGNGEIQLFDESKTLLQTVPIVSRKGDRNSFASVDNVKYVQYKNTSGTMVYVSQFHVSDVEDLIPPSNITGLTVSNVTTTSAQFDWVNPTEPDFTGTKIYVDGVFQTSVNSSTSTFTVNDLTGAQTYTFKFSTIDSSGNESTGTTQTVTTLTPIDTTPPAIPINVQAVGIDGAVNLTWDANIESDFAGYNLYRSLDGSSYSKVNVGLITNTNYTVSGINDQTYYFQLSAVDADGNESARTIPVSATPQLPVDETAPAVPTSVELLAVGNEFVSVRWSTNNELDLMGYNVYVNGVKHNTTPTSSSSYYITGLTNDTEYSIEVTAVDLSGNESLKSIAVLGTPVAMAVPFVSMGYDLSNVSDGVGSWFGSLWLALAFSLAIPLSFYILLRMKRLFLN